MSVCIFVNSFIYPFIMIFQILCTLSSSKTNKNIKKTAVNSLPFVTEVTKKKQLILHNTLVSSFRESATLCKYRKLYLKWQFCSSVVENLNTNSYLFN